MEINKIDIAKLKNDVSNLNKQDFDELIRYLNDLNKKNWLENFKMRNKNIDITEEEIINLVKETRKELYENRN